jgi:hypothetical protein
MAKCTYCGQSSGILKEFHEECKQRNLQGWAEMVALAHKAASGQESCDDLVAKLAAISEFSFIPESWNRRALVAGWAQMLDQFLDDSILTQDEQRKLLEFANRFDLTPEELNTNGAYDRAIKANILSELLQGRTPEAQVNFSLPFNLKKTEIVVYLFPSVSYLEERTRRTYVGGSHGVSVRVMRGVYYRVGAFKAKPVVTSQMEYIDSGLLLITSENLYYRGDRKSFRVPYSKIVSFTQYADGIGFHRDAASAKPQILITGDGWFTCNLIENLARMATERQHCFPIDAGGFNR